MKTEEIFLLEPDKAIKQLKKRVNELPDTDKMDSEYNPLQHLIFDEIYRPDKKVVESEGKAARTEFVSRICVPAQKLIVSRAASFLFANEPILKATTKTQQEKDIVYAAKKVQNENKSHNRNMHIARLVMRYTEAAECWYAVEGKNTNENYGFKTKFKLRQRLFSTENGDILFPLFDEYEDLVAFSREYKVIEEDSKTTTYFETWMEDKYYLFKKEETWALEYSQDNPLGKIPIVYIRQPYVEWADVQVLIERLEKLLSNFADTNDYHGSPKIFVKGKILGFSKKGESGAIIEGDSDSSAQYLAWPYAPESIKLEIETLLRLINSGTQTPDISFDSIKGLNPSGVALELLFMDAHLKVYDKKEIFGNMLQRRLSIIKSFIGMMNTGLKATADEMVLTAEIVPYIINDEKALIDKLVSATGGEPLLSQETAVSMTGLVDDAEDELIKLNAQADKFVNEDLFNPTK